MKKAEREAERERVEHFARLFRESGDEYRCGAVIMAFVRDHPEYDGNTRLPRLVWKKVHENHE